MTLVRLPRASGHPVLGQEGGHIYLCQLPGRLILDRHVIAPVSGEVKELDVFEGGICLGKRAWHLYNLLNRYFKC